MRLPPELMMRVCDILAEENDIQTMQSYALLCSQLTSHCQSHLFAHINLYLHEFKESSIRRLSEILRVHSELADYIKSIHLSFLDSAYFDNADVRSVLSRCTKVSTFELLSQERRHAGVLPDATAQVLQPIVHSPFLTKIIVSGSTVPLATFFARCHDSLTHFDYGAFGHAHIELPSVTVIGAKTKFLRSLNARLPTVWCLLQFKREDNQAIFDLSQLREFTTADLANALDIQRLNTILHYAVCLERLSLRSHSDDDFYLTGLLNSTLPCIKTLRYIHLDLSVQWNSSQQGLPRFRGVLDELRRFPAHNILEDVEIHMTLIDDQRWAVIIDEWLLLATAFKEKSFPCLKSVKVRVEVGNMNQGGWADIVADDLENLPFGNLQLHYDFMFTRAYDYDLVRIECRKSKWLKQYA